MNKVLLILFVFGAAFQTAAAPWNYDSASADIKEYVVDSITNCICIASVALMHEKVDECEGV